MKREQLLVWLEAYERAWRAPGTETLGELFSEDASYSAAPYEDPRRGLEAISSMWDSERNPGEAFTLRTEIIAVDGDTGVVRVQVDYEQPRRQQYRDLWIVRLDGTGRCVHFEEWPFWPPGSAGGVAADA
jgi:hypothetical protein